MNMTDLTRRLLPAAAVLAISTTGCGGDDPKPAAASPAPSATVNVDQWAVQTCEQAAKDADLAAQTVAKMSTNQELVDAALKAEQTDNIQLIKAWCQRNYPQASVVPDTPSPG